MKGRALYRNTRRSGLKEFRCVEFEGLVGHVQLDIQDLNPLKGYELGRYQQVNMDELAKEWLVD